MKKKSTSEEFRSFYERLRRKQRLIASIGLFCCSSMALQASVLEDQVNLSITNSTLKNALEQIGAQANVSIIYSTDVLNDKTIVSLSNESITLEDALTALLVKENCSFMVEDGQVVIYKTIRKNSSSQLGLIISQKKVTVKGIVVDEAGLAVIGANIILKNSSSVGTVTDIDGVFSISVPVQSVLTISYIGYSSQNIKIVKGKPLHVVLLEDSQTMDEVVVVGYGTQRKVSVVGSITNIDAAQLKVPSSSLTSSFAGRLAGVISTTSSGEPGQNNNDFYIRGIGTFGGRSTPLIMLDGVEITSSDLNYIPAESIENFSVLKDASATAIYGARGANGVMLVTTKKGTKNQKAKINVSVDNSFNIPQAFPDFVDGATYMEMFNEAISTRSGSLEGLRYTQDKIDGTRAGLNPYIYPDVNWEPLLFKDFSMSQRANINLSGGGSKVTYYMSIQANHDSGILNTQKAYSWNNNVDVMNYTFQNNVNYQLTTTTNVGLRMNAQLRQSKGPNIKTSDLFGQMIQANPVAYPAYFPSSTNPNIKHIMFGNAFASGTNMRTNPYATMMNSFKQNFSSTIMTTLDVEQALDMLTKGLKLKGLVNFKNYSESSFNRSIEPYWYNVQAGSFDPYSVGPNSPFEVERLGSSGTDYISSSDIAKAGDRSIFMQFWLDYARSFGNHSVGAMLLYQQREFNTKVLPTRNQGISGRLTYNYDSRYLIEGNFGYNGTERLADGHRFQFFPSVALGWVVSSEKFFQPVSNVITNLKLRGSFGYVGNDETGLAGGTGPHFIYLDDITLGNQGYTTGVDLNTTLNGPTINVYGNPNAVWEVAQKTNIGLDIDLYDKLSVVVDFFQDKRSDILLKRESWPEQLGFSNGKPWGNVGRVVNKGMDMSVNYRQPINKDLSVELRGTFTFAQNELIENDEPSYPNAYEYAAGRPLSYSNGFIAERLFIDQADVDNSPYQDLGSKVKPGDIKYKDLNGDGRITNSDMTMISPYNSMPQIMYGFGSTVMWKKFDFGAFFQGAAKRQISVNGVHPFGTGERNVLQFIADDYWSESNPNPEAAYPRLDVLAANGSHNNTVSSSYWMRDGSYLRLKNAEIGYRFSFGRLYINGSNLLTFSPFKNWDPELAWNSYPLQRTFNLGVQFNF